MHRFFAERISDRIARLSPDEAQHAVRVLRMKPGDACQVVIERCLFNASVEELEPETLVRIGDQLPSPEAGVRITLFQGLPKAEKMEWIIQKGTECGIDRIVPVLFSRCVTKWDSKDGNKKIVRWQRIALEAAKQSGRTVVPEIAQPITLKALCGELGKFELPLIPWEEAEGKGIPSFYAQQKSAAIVIGPEGGISEEEILLLKDAGGIPVTLGPRIFRTETAGLAAAVSLLTLSGDMGR